MNISYIVKNTNKQLAKQKAESRLINEYSNIISRRLISARKKNFKDKEKEEFVSILPSDYEVKFRININGIRYDKCLIISTNNENEINNLLKKKCKKEFKNYRSLTGISYKLADKNSKEYSIRVEENIKNLKK